MYYCIIPLVLGYVAGASCGYGRYGRGYSNYGCGCGCGCGYGRGRYW